MEWILIAGLALAAGLIWWFSRPAVARGIPQSADDLLAAIDTAHAGPGHLFGDPPSIRFPGSQARLWALSTLYEAGVDADADPAYAAEILVRMQPKLTRPDADALIRALNHP